MEAGSGFDCSRCAAGASARFLERRRIRASAGAVCGIVSDPLKSASKT